jgi:hypothetical protein
LVESIFGVIEKRRDLQEGKRKKVIGRIIIQAMKN